MENTKKKINGAEKIIGFRVNTKVYQEFRTICASKNITTSSVFKKLMTEWLEKEWKRSNEVIERAKVG